MSRKEDATMPAPEIRTPAMLYAHAIALEREAAARYAQLSERMAALGESALGEVFTMLSGFEDDHLDTLLRRTDGVAVPEFAAVPWPAGEGPETATREFDVSRATPRGALEAALAAERRAQAFFAHVHATASDPALRALAQEMEAEEQQHIALIEREIRQRIGAATPA